MGNYPTVDMPDRSGAQRYGPAAVHASRPTWAAFWGDNGGRGRNWTGRLLELIRSDIHMAQSGVPGL
ncbi:hypothetical protein OG728_37300 [Streptomyces microflavus]|uniref:hypothetical protein n=1 Tax=Streptomyces TaxID=1883 RepID=UPI00117ECD16|nr:MULTISPECIES: hypothetical protein [Streptomyces]WSR95724.1 hypothetical protein OG728_37300 [Streptomyces microflavus]